MKQLGLFYKQRGMAVAETAEAIHGDWVKRADAAIVALAGKVYPDGSHWPFTAEDVRRYAGDPVHPGAIGARLNAAARKGIIEFTGQIVTASRPERHASALRLWVGK